MVQVCATLYDRPAIDNSDFGPQLINFSELTASRINATEKQVKGLYIFKYKQQFWRSLSISKQSVEHSDRTRSKRHREYSPSGPAQKEMIEKMQYLN